MKNDDLERPGQDNGSGQGRYLRALRKIADMPIGKNPLAEAQAMREIARSVACHPAEERDRD